MKIYHNKTFDCYEDCEQDINVFGKEIFLDGHKLYTKADVVAILTELQLEIKHMTPMYFNKDYTISDLVRNTQVTDMIQAKINELKIKGK